MFSFFKSKEKKNQINTFENVSISTEDVKNNVVQFVKNNKFIKKELNGAVEYYAIMKLTSFPVDMIDMFVISDNDLKKVKISAYKFDISNSEPAVESEVLNQLLTTLWNMINC
jgi:hypothetical protein